MVASSEEEITVRNAMVLLYVILYNILIYYGVGVYIILRNAAVVKAVEATHTECRSVGQSTDTHPFPPLHSRSAASPHLLSHSPVRAEDSDHGVSG
jgi:hypothetical protein